MNLYSLTIPTLQHGLCCLKSILHKAAKHADASDYDPDNLLTLRFAPDMFGLPKQIQIACDLATRAGARLSGAELPSFADDEASLSDLIARIDASLEYLAKISEDSLDGAEAREVDIPVGGGNTQTMPVPRYITGFLLPNFYFHLTTTYNLLRSNGVPLGKRDFLVP